MVGDPDEGAEGSDSPTPSSRRSSSYSFVEDLRLGYVRPHRTNMRTRVRACAIIVGRFRLDL